MPRSRQTTRPLPPRRQGSSLGPFAFLIAVAVLVVGLYFVARPLAEDAVVAYVAEHDTLLRQDFVRGLVADRVRNEVDLAKDTRADNRPFVIARGETAGEIAKRLEEEGFIRSALAFGYILYESERENALQSGTYTVSAALTPREIAKLFERAPGEQIILRIIDGWRLTEVATAVNKAFPSITKEAFTAAAVVGDRKNTVLAGMEPAAPLEGYLFPDTYFMRPDMTAPQIVEVLLDTFERKVGATLRTASARRNMPIYDLVKLASIIEREARDRGESATIAGVFTNRLDIGMKLDADPTIQYALGEWRELSLADLRLDSPYNTYLYAGLPPTPIANPGAAALEGAANPAKVPYFFFVAKSDGTGGHAFSVTLEEHEANRVKYGNR
ncbi:MAG TPA: endolytic transglycosylase MltG [Candidatus Limnocylindria bacterium]|nr:endolytic transglycosylase MltG [Candidatus Limnocylindria bacterium]